MSKRPTPKPHPKPPGLALGAKPGKRRQAILRPVLGCGAVCYRLPFPPSVNHYWKDRIGGGKCLSKQATVFRKRVLRICRDPMRKPLDGRLSIRIAYTMPDARERDLDNYQKGLLDALQHARVFYKDSQVDHLELDRSSVEPPGYCDVVIEEISDGK